MESYPVQVVSNQLLKARVDLPDDLLVRRVLENCFAD